MSPQGRGVLAGLFRRYGAWLRRRLGLLYGPEAADDLVQEAFLRAARYSEAGSKVHFPKALLLRIARNAASSAGAQARSRQPHVNLERWAEAEADEAGQGASQDPVCCFPERPGMQVIGGRERPDLDVHAVCFPTIVRHNKA